MFGTIRTQCSIGSTRVLNYFEFSCIMRCVLSKGLISQIKWTVFVDFQFLSVKNQVVKLLVSCFSPQTLAKLNTRTILYGHYNWICPEEQKFFVVEVLSAMELWFEIQGCVLSWLQDLLDSIWDIFKSLRAEISAFVAWNIDLLIELLEILDCVDHCTWGYRGNHKVRVFVPEPSY